MLMQEFEGKTEKEAIKTALKTLGLSEDQVTIESIDDGRAGFFGFRGGRPARIKVYYEEVEGEVSLRARKFLKGFFDASSVNAKVAYEKEEEGKIYLKVTSPTSGLIIGKRGKNLEALQFLTNVVANKNKPEWKKVVIDIEGYWNKRESSIKKLAIQTARSVRKTRKPRILEPMNPFERRLVHLTLQELDDIETKSEGEGIYKRVKVSFKS